MKEWLYSFWLNDSKTDPRATFFSPETSEYIRVLKNSMLSFGWVGPLFPSAARIRQVVNEMLKDLGLKNGADGRGPHTFRHYTASYLFYFGNMRIEDIAFLMGVTADTMKKRVRLNCLTLFLVQHKFADQNP